MLTRDFTDRTRARVAETRAVITKLRDAGKEALRQIAKIDKQQSADRDRVSDRIGQLAEDLVDKLPEGATEADVDRADALRDEIITLSATIEEVSLAGSAVEDLGGMLNDTIRMIYAQLKEAESQSTVVDRLGAKLGV